MYLTSYIKSLIVSLTILTLTTLVSVNSLAETATSGNLLPNAGDGVNTNAQNSNSTIDGIDSSSGFTLNGITDYSSNYNELEAQGTGTVSASGSLLNITTTKQSGGTHTTTETSLDGGVTLNATTEVQNCEWSGSSYQCGQATSGRDSFQTTIKIIDGSNNTLAITTFNRNNDAGYRQNTHTYTDTATHTGTGARNWDWEWKGIDGNSPNSTSPVGPNLLGAALTATLLDINYTPITEETEEEIELAEEIIELAQEDLATAITLLEEIQFEQLTELELETPLLQELEIEIKEIEIEEFEEIFISNFKEIMIEENVMETFETALIEEGLTEEEFFEETTTMVIEVLKEEFEMEETNTFKEELNEETAMTEETQMEEVKEEEIKEEEIKEESKQEESNETITTETNSNEEVKEESNEATEERESGESVSNESEVAEDKETEGTKEEETDGENVEDEAVESNEREVVSIKENSISVKVQKVLDKVLSKLKRVDQKLQAIQMVTSQGITSGEADLSGYINKRIYKNQVALNGVPDPEFFQNLNILEQQQIYKDANLAAYTNNDPIAVKQEILQEIKVEKNRLLLEIKMLKEG
jgi:hypothetical protein